MQAVGAFLRRPRGSGGGGGSGRGGGGGGGGGGKWWFCGSGFVLVTHVVNYGGFERNRILDGERNFREREREREGLDMNVMRGILYSFFTFRLCIISIRKIEILANDFLSFSLSTFDTVRWSLSSGQATRELLF